jgi:hypothetical protein
VLALDVLLLAFTESFGYARPLFVFLFLACSLAAILDLRVAVAILFLVSALDGFIKGWLGGSTYSLLLKDYFLALALACWLSGTPWRARGSSWHDSIRVPMAVLAIWVLTQLFNPHASGRYQASLAGARAWLIWLGVFFVVRDAMSTWRMARLLAIWLVGLGALCGAYGLLQHIYGVGFLGEASQASLDRAAMYGWTTEAGERVGRIYGTTVHPGVFGTFMGQAILLGIGAFIAWGRRWHRWIPVGCAVVAVIALLLSGSRTSMVAAVVGLLAMILANRNIRLPLLLAMVLVPGILLTGRLSEMAFQRGLDIWDRRTHTIERGWEPLQAGFLMALERPLGHGVDAGVGVPDVLVGRVATSALAMENDYARALVELGFPGLFIYGWLLWACLRLGYRACLETRGTPAFGLALAFLGCVVMTEVALMTGAVLYLAPGAQVFWASVAGGAALLRATEAQTEASGKEAGPRGRSAARASA